MTSHYRPNMEPCPSSTLTGGCTSSQSHATTKKMEHQQQQQEHYRHGVDETATSSNAGMDGVADISDIMLLSMPTEIELTMLCLDHLRSMRRSMMMQQQQQQHHLQHHHPRNSTMKDTGKRIDADYLTMALWALNRAIVTTDEDRSMGQSANDPFNNIATATTGTIIAANTTSAGTRTHVDENIAPYTNLRKVGVDYSDSHHNNINIPTLKEMEREVLPDRKAGSSDEKYEDEIDYYDDYHNSNRLRFYTQAGLGEYPLNLGELIVAGLTGLAARSRIQAERDLVQCPIFAQFLQAVCSKGFFENVPNEQIYTDRYSKVVAKYRRKVNQKVKKNGDLMIVTAVETYRQQIMNGGVETVEVTKTPMTVANLPVPDIYVPRVPCHPASPSRALSQPLSVAQSFSRVEHCDSFAVIANPIDLDEAEKYKNKGNACMQRKDYETAIQQYTKALKLMPSGPHSHVYFSNRAAALVSIKKFDEAVKDSERALALKPDYGKAHARLGLAHFLLGNYRQATEAYTVALKYEPNNQSSQNYLEKSAARLAKTGESTNTAASYSVVAEWEKHNNNIDPEESANVIKEAEKYKLRGNSLMANGEYAQAVSVYTKAIQLNPHGVESHTYYSNRAAALCYLEQYRDAEVDSLKSLQLKPDYAKAHARLGLSRFFLKDYVGSIKAYKQAIRYDPENTASHSYLAKAESKLKASKRVV